MFNDGISRPAIEATHKLIGEYVRRTPVIEIDAAEFGLAPGRLTLKLELMQHSGSFKARGAFASLLGEAVPAAGVAAASGGNHGAAVAYAAQRLGIKAHIFVPRISSLAKIERIRSYGADLVVDGATYADAFANAKAWVATSGARTIHAFDQRGTVLGQATAAREFEAQAPDLDTLLVAVGGGGLIAGAVAWYEGAVKIVGVEPRTAPTLNAALAAGQPVDVAVSGLAADSLGARRAGDLCHAIAARHVKEVVLLEDAAIAEAQRLLWDRLRVVAEPGGAAAMAALLSGAYRQRPGEHVGVLVCGGNTTAVAFEA